MQSEELETITNSIKSKLGDDNVALIADDLGTLITRNIQVHNNLLEKDNEITKLKEEKEKLVVANGNLLQRIPIGTSSKAPKEYEEEVKKSFNFRSVFDFSFTLTPHSNFTRRLYWLYLQIISALFTFPTTPTPA